MRSRKYCFQKVALFLQRNNVLDAVTSNIDSFLHRDACVLQLSLIGLIGTKRAYLHLEKTKLQEVSL
jgi:hypothetical protein